jgi:hypothetical protein
MKVIDIDITGVRYDRAAACHEGHVTLALRSEQGGPETHVHFLCHSKHLQDCAPSLITEDLIADALRQAHRMPGFRRGERQIELAVDDHAPLPRVASA